MSFYCLKYRKKKKKESENPKFVETNNRKIRLSSKWAVRESKNRDLLKSKKQKNC